MKPPNCVFNILDDSKNCEVVCSFSNLAQFINFLDTNYLTHKPTLTEKIQTKRKRKQNTNSTQNDEHLPDTNSPPSTSIPQEENKEAKTNWLICEQVFEIDMVLFSSVYLYIFFLYFLLLLKLKVLHETLSILSTDDFFCDKNDIGYADNIAENNLIKNFMTNSFIFSTNNSFVIPVRQPFVAMCENKKKSFDTLDRLDIFRLRENLKGKKMPNEKKNYDAQLFESLNSAQRCLSNTKEYFKHLNKQIIPRSIDMQQMVQFSVPQINDVVFLLLCSTETALNASYMLSNSKKVAYRRSKKNTSERTPRAQQDEYLHAIYNSIQKKKKIYKTPSKMSIHYSSTKKSLVISACQCINWFTSNWNIISN